MEVIRGIAYVVVQCLGGLVRKYSCFLLLNYFKSQLGGALLEALVPEESRGKGGLGSTQLGEGVSVAQVP